MEQFDPDPDMALGRILVEPTAALWLAAPLVGTWLHHQYP